MVLIVLVAEEVAGDRGAHPELREALDGGLALAGRAESPGRAGEGRARATGGRPHFAGVADDSKVEAAAAERNAQVLQVHGRSDLVSVQTAGEFEKGVT